jgi:hypothetical protein
VRELGAGTDMLRRVVLVQFGNELRFLVEHVRRRCGQLLPRLLESHHLCGFLFGFLQRRLHRQFDVRGDRRGERQCLVQRRLDLSHHLYRLVLRELHERDL